MGCYSFDTIFRVLQARGSFGRRSSSHRSLSENLPERIAHQLQFSQRGDMPPVKFTWYDGGLKPPRPEDSKPTAPSPWKVKMEKKVSLSSVTKEKSSVASTAPSRGLIPDAKMKSLSATAQTLPRSPGNEREWLDAAKRWQNKARR